jgi:hypothetical protein
MVGLIAEVPSLVAVIISSLVAVVVPSLVAVIIRMILAGRGLMIVIANGRRSACRWWMLSTILSTVTVFVRMLGKCGDTQDQQCR